MVKKTENNAYITCRRADGTKRVLFTAQLQLAEKTIAFSGIVIPEQKGEVSVGRAIMNHLRSKPKEEHVLPSLKKAPHDGLGFVLREVPTAHKAAQYNDKNIYNVTISEEEFNHVLSQIRADQSKKDEASKKTFFVVADLDAKGNATKVDALDSGKRWTAAYKHRVESMLTQTVNAPQVGGKIDAKNIEPELLKAVSRHADTGRATDFYDTLDGVSADISDEPAQKEETRTLKQMHRDMMSDVKEAEKYAKKLGLPNHLAEPYFADVSDRCKLVNILRDPRRLPGGEHYSLVKAAFEKVVNSHDYQFGEKQYHGASFPAVASPFGRVRDNRAKESGAWSNDSKRYIGTAKILTTRKPSKNLVGTLLNKGLASSVSFIVRPLGALPYLPLFDHTYGQIRSWQINKDQAEVMTRSEKFNYSEEFKAARVKLLKEDGLCSLLDDRREEVFARYGSSRNEFLKDRQAVRAAGDDQTKFKATFVDAQVKAFNDAATKNPGSSVISNGMGDEVKLGSLDYFKGAKGVFDGLQQYEVLQKKLDIDRWKAQIKEAKENEASTVTPRFVNKALQSQPTDFFLTSISDANLGQFWDDNVKKVLPERFKFFLEAYKLARKADTSQSVKKYLKNYANAKTPDEKAALDGLPSEAIDTYLQAQREAQELRGKQGDQRVFGDLANAQLEEIKPDHDETSSAINRLKSLQTEINKDTSIAAAERLSKYEDKQKKGFTGLRQKAIKASATDVFNKLKILAEVTDTEKLTPDQRKTLGATNREQWLFDAKRRIILKDYGYATGQTANTYKAYQKARFIEGIKAGRALQDPMHASADDGGLDYLAGFGDDKVDEATYLKAQKQTDIARWMSDRSSKTNIFNTLNGRLKIYVDPNIPKVDAYTTAGAYQVALSDYWDSRHKELAQKRFKILVAEKAAKTTDKFLTGKWETWAKPRTEAQFHRLTQLANAKNAGELEKTPFEKVFLKNACTEKDKKNMLNTLGEEYKPDESLADYLSRQKEAFLKPSVLTFKDNNFQDKAVRLENVDGHNVPADLLANERHKEAMQWQKQTTIDFSYYDQSGEKKYKTLSKQNPKTMSEAELNGVWDLHLKSHRAQRLREVEIYRSRFKQYQKVGGLLKFGAWKVDAENPKPEVLWKDYFWQQHGKNMAKFRYQKMQDLIKNDVIPDEWRKKQGDSNYGVSVNQRADAEYHEHINQRAEKTFLDSLTPFSDADKVVKNSVRKGKNIQARIYDAEKLRNDKADMRVRKVLGKAFPKKDKQKIQLQLSLGRLAIAGDASIADDKLLERISTLQGDVAAYKKEVLASLRIQYPDAGIDFEQSLEKASKDDFEHWKSSVKQVDHGGVLTDVTKRNDQHPNSFVVTEDDFNKLYSKEAAFKATSKWEARQYKKQDKQQANKDYAKDVKKYTEHTDSAIDNRKAIIKKERAILKDAKTYETWRKKAARDKYAEKAAIMQQRDKRLVRMADGAVFRKKGDERYGLADGLLRKAKPLSQFKKMVDDMNDYRTGARGDYSELMFYFLTGLLCLLQALGSKSVKMAMATTPRGKAYAILEDPGKVKKLVDAIYLAAERQEDGSVKVNMRSLESLSGFKQKLDESAVKVAGAVIALQFGFTPTNIGQHQTQNGPQSLESVATRISAEIDDVPKAYASKYKLKTSAHSADHRFKKDEDKDKGPGNSNPFGGMPGAGF